VADARRVVGIVPAAGHGSRLQPLEGSKEMLAVGGRPVLEYVIERMRAAQPAEIRVVTRPEKRDVARHARGLGAQVIEGRPPSLAASLALGAAGLDPPDVILFGFPDTIWEPPDGFRTLLAALDGGVDVVLGVFRWDEAGRSQVVELEPDGTVTAVHANPAPASSDRVWGCAAFAARSLAELERCGDPGLLFDALARRGRVRGVFLSSQFADIGTRRSLERVGAKDAAG
jgi:glucose-1-phosphate thymidylyltransferase